MLNTSHYIQYYSDSCSCSFVLHIDDLQHQEICLKADSCYVFFSVEHPICPTHDLWKTPLIKIKIIIFCATLVAVLITFPFLLCTALLGIVHSCSLLGIFLYLWTILCC